MPLQLESSLKKPVSVAVGPVEVSVILPPQGAEKAPDDLTRFFLECLMDNMVTQVGAHRGSWYGGLWPGIGVKPAGTDTLSFIRSESSGSWS